jgi:hypothetical protein
MEDFVMKRLVLIAGLMIAFLLVVLTAGAQNKVNFAGTWSLDKAKSQGLSPRMQGADSVTLTITQDDKQISVESKVVGGQPPAGGSPGSGAGGGRGFGGGMGSQTYNLDGTESTADVGGGQMTGKATMKATWSGSTLELARKTTFNGPNGEITSTSSQKLSLSGDGKVLTAMAHSEGPRGTTDSTLVFNRQ